MGAKNKSKPVMRASHAARALKQKRKDERAAEAARQARLREELDAEKDKSK